MTAMKVAAIAAVAITAATIGVAVAQNQSTQGSSGWTWGPRGMMGYGPPAGMMGAMGPGMMGWGGAGEAMCNAMAGHIDGRLAYVKAELKISEAQESLWNSYAAAARDSANTVIARCTSMVGQRKSALSLPERLDQNEQLLAAQLDAVRAMNKALKPFYAALDDSQKQTADQMLWGPMGMM